MECEQDSIRRIQSGNAGEFEQVVRQYQSLLFTVCMNVLHNEHHAENITQEAFMSAYCSLSAFHGDSLKAWLCRIAVNKAIDFRRKQARIQNTEMDFEQYAYSLADNDPIEEQAEQRERAGKLKAILLSLPPKYKAVVSAHYFDHLTIPQIGTALNLPPKTVETQLYRARKLLKERWKDERDP